ncbi:hypothetical protein SCA6_011035 [Theobroma cacao]
MLITYVLGKFQCRPYPHEYVDAFKALAHYACFMGLQRKHGEVVQKVSMWMFWKPGMEISISYVHRNQLPTSIFPNGYKRPRKQRLTPHHKLSHDNGIAFTKSGGKCLKREIGS